MSSRRILGILRVRLRFTFKSTAWGYHASWCPHRESSELSKSSIFQRGRRFPDEHSKTGFSFNAIQGKIATWDFSLNESHGFVINHVGVSTLVNGWLRNLICRIFSLRTIISSKDGAPASTRRKLTDRRSLPRRAVGGLRWMVPFNPPAFRLCSMDFHETLIKENFLFLAIF